MIYPTDNPPRRVGDQNLSILTTLLNTQTHTLTNNLTQTRINEKALILWEMF